MNSRTNNKRAAYREFRLSEKDAIHGHDVIQLVKGQKSWAVSIHSSEEEEEEEGGDDDEEKNKMKKRTREEKEQEEQEQAET